MNKEQKIKRQTKVQFFFQQTEQRRNKNTFAIKSFKQFHCPIKSQRQVKIFKLENLSSDKIGNTSCCCEDCGRASSFQQRQFQIYPFDGTAQQRNLIEKNKQILDRYRNSKFIRVFRRLVHCLQFIIRYRIVQNIRNRQRTRLKKAMKTRVDQQHRMTFLNVLDLAAKQYHISPKYKSATNFEFIMSENNTALNSPQDSDEEFYHLKPRKSLIRKCSSEDQNHHPKLTKCQQKVYFLTSSNTILNKYISQKLASKNGPNKSCLPPILSLTVSPKQQQQQQQQPHCKIKIRHNK